MKTAALLAAAVTLALAGSVLADVTLTQTTTAIKADPASQAAVGVNVNGAGVLVVNLDDNIDSSHPALTQVQAVVDYSGAGLGDFSYHAEQSASVIVGNGNSGLIGVAPGATLIAAKVSSRQSVADAIYSQSNGPQQPKVFSASFGFGPATDGSDSLDLFIDWAANKYNLVFVKSAGNSGANGAGTITIPGDTYNSIVVGGTNQAFNQVVNFSSEGKTTDGRNKPDILAPAENLTMANAFFKNGINGDFKDKNNNGLIGLNQSTVVQQYDSYLSLQNAAANPVTSLSVTDVNANGIFDYGYTTIGGIQYLTGDLVNTPLSGNPNNVFVTRNGANQITSIAIRTNTGFDVADGTGNPLTNVSSGTSFAAPSVAGAAALLEQFAAQQGKSNDHRLIKSLMLTGADNTGVTRKDGTAWAPSNPGTTPLDDQMGAGQLNTALALDIFNHDQVHAFANTNPITWDVDTIGANGTIDYKINKILAGGSTLTASIVWDRIVTKLDDNSSLAAGQFTATQLADLDITLLNQTTGLPLNIQDALGHWSYSKSSVDPEELIFFQLPADGLYTLEVNNLSGFSADYGMSLLSFEAPEPASLAILALGGLALLRRRR